MHIKSPSTILTPFIARSALNLKPLILLIAWKMDTRGIFSGGLWNTDQFHISQRRRKESETGTTQTGLLMSPPPTGGMSRTRFLIPPPNSNDELEPPHWRLRPWASSLSSPHSLTWWAYPARWLQIPRMSPPLPWIQALALVNHWLPSTFTYVTKRNLRKLQTSNKAF